MNIDTTDTKFHPKLLQALEDNTFKELVRVKGGSLIITIIKNDSPVDCDYEGCYDFAEYLTLFLDYAGEDLHANLCDKHLKQHIEHSKSNYPYVVQ